MSSDQATNHSWHAKCTRVTNLHLYNDKISLEHGNQLRLKPLTSHAMDSQCLH